MIIASFLLFIFFTIIDSVTLFKNKEIKVIIIYYIMILISAVLVILIALDVEIPSPADAFEAIIKKFINIDKGG